MITFPNAKINLGLHISKKRGDGFHDIETILYPVQWCDALEIVPDEKAKETCHYKGSGIKMYSKDKPNLCTRSYHLLAEKFPLHPIKMHLHKTIPIGAGLGGGSSDAAYSLTMLNTLFNLKLTNEQLLGYASQLGSDCPFFLRNKVAFASGRGDQLEEIKLDLKNYFITIVKPKVHVSTAEAYRGAVLSKPTGSLKELIRLPVTKWKDSIFNDFEKTIFEKFNIIKNIKAKLYKYGAIYASMSGSGSSVYGIFPEAKLLDSSFRNCTVWSGRL